MSWCCLNLRMHHVNKFTLVELEPSTHLSCLCHTEQSFAHISPIYYPGTLRHLTYLYPCMIHPSKAPQDFLNTFWASSSFLFPGIAFCDQRLLYSKSSTPSFFNRTTGKGLYSIQIIGSKWVWIQDWVDASMKWFFKLSTIFNPTTHDSMNEYM